MRAGAAHGGAFEGSGGKKDVTRKATAFRPPAKFGRGSGIADRYTAVATYTGTTTSSYVKGYTVSADYTGTVSHIALDRVRYVAIFEGKRVAPVEIDLPVPEQEHTALGQFPWQYVLVPVGVIALVGAGIGVALRPCQKIFRNTTGDF